MATLFLATVIGAYMVIFSLYIFFKQEHLKLITAEIMGHPAMLFIIAVITVILGLLLVASHNIWIMGWPVVITIFSWLVLIGGLIRLFLPDMVYRIWQSIYKNNVIIIIFGIVLLIVGLFLLAHVYLLR